MSATARDRVERQRPEEPPRDAEPIGFERFPLFDSGRAIAVILVVAVHAAGMARLGAGGLSAMAGRLDVGVTIFFLISGFLLYRPFVAAHAAGVPQPSTGAYAWRRILRIIPAYWLALTVSALVLNLPGVLTAHGVATYYGFAQIYSRATHQGGIGPAWSLDIEVAFYVFLPLYALAIQRLIRSRWGNWARVEFLGVIAIAALANVYKALIVFTTPRGHFYPVALGFPPAFFDLFAVGMGLAVLSVWIERGGAGLPAPLRITDQWPFVPWLGAAVAFALLQIFGVGVTYRPPVLTHAEVFAHDWLYAAVALGVLLPIAFGDPRRGLVRRLLGNRALLYVGTISYGIFLWHRPIFTEADRLGIQLGAGGGAWVGWTLFGVAAAGVIAACSWHGLERPILGLKRLIPDRARLAARASRVRVESLPGATDTT